MGLSCDQAPMRSLPARPAPVRCTTRRPTDQQQGHPNRGVSRSRSQAAWWQLTLSQSQHTPVRPMDRVMPLAITNFVIWAEALGSSVGVEHDPAGQVAA